MKDVAVLVKPSKNAATYIDDGDLGSVKTSINS